LSDKTISYQLTIQAVTDLEEIWRYSAEKWSIEQADTYTDDLTDTFDLLASMPTLGRERTEFSPPVRIHAHGHHLIVYTLKNNAVIIIRILGGKQDWQAILERIDGN
jgi:toxin ParE1/3/4